MLFFLLIAVLIFSAGDHSDHIYYYNSKNFNCIGALSFHNSKNLNSIGALSVFIIRRVLEKYLFIVYFIRVNFEARNGTSEKVGVVFVLKVLS